ncbi:DUF927 domain-containing protein [Candidatus Igneacidithiobacillus taiwanensis]|uniref:DUF927 domain-containing protein n=1 Tax=Candidatus Igneacidithiobacillus taiwanensis TaxID=1945924 RepID=UPI002898CEE3|nr:DUF927 domain-containing protein [Candidatus Igneacidithiobacillus taiwanensis]
MVKKIHYQKIKEAALDKIPEIVEELGLDYKISGNEIQFLNPHRQDNEFGSASINTETGIWADFAVDDAKGDLLDFVKYIRNFPSIRDAAEWLQNFLDREGDSLNVTGDEEPQLPVQSHDSGTSMVPTTSMTPAESSSSESSRPVMDRQWFPVAYDEKEHISPYKSHPALKKPTAVYPYHYADGKVAFFVYRFDLPDGSKEIRPQTLMESTDGFIRWEWKGLPSDRPVYNLPEILARPDATVVVVEGEKAAEAARILLPDFVVTTSANGAKSPKKTDWSVLHGRNVLLWPDNDEAGINYVKAVTRLVNASFHFISLQNEHLERSPEGNWVVVPGGAPEGYDAADLQQQGITPEEFGQLLPELVKEGVPGGEPVGSLEHQLNMKLRAARFAGYRYRDSNLLAIKTDKNGNERAYPIASLFYVNERLLNERRNGYKYVLHIQDPLGEFSEYILPASSLFDRSDFRKELADHGMMLNPKARDELIYFIQNSPHQGINRFSATIGWTPDRNSFLLPSETFTRAGQEGGGQYRLHIPTSAQNLVQGFRTSGTLEGWQEYVAKPCDGNKLLEMTLFLALLPPLLEPLQLPNMGIHFFGETSKGKSTALRVGASAWGNPKQLVNSWRATDNGLESVAYYRNDALMVLDEVNQGTPTAVSNLIYMGGNGLGKIRGKGDGSARPIKDWRLAYLSSGETSIADFLRSDGNRELGGQAVRMLDFSIEAGRDMGIVEELGAFSSASELVRHLNAATRHYFGTASVAFLRQLLALGSYDDLGRELEAFRSAFLTACLPGEASPQVERIVEQLANVAFAGELAIRYAVIPFPEGQAKETMVILTRRYLDQRGGLEGSDVLGTIESIRRQISANRFSCFQQVDQRGGRNSFIGSLPPRTFWGYALVQEEESVPNEFMVPVAIFKDVFCHGVSYRDVLRVMYEKGYVESTQAEPFGKNRSRCFHILPAFLEGQQEEQQEEQRGSEFNFDID